MATTSQEPSDASTDDFNSNDPPPHTQSETTNAKINEIRRAQNLLFSDTIRDPIKQAEIMSFCVIGTLNEVGNCARDLIAALSSFQSFSTEHFRMEISKAMCLTRLPVVKNSDNTLSLIRPAFAEVVEHHFMSFTEVYAVFDENQETDSVSCFRPWAQTPDAVVDWWRRKSGHLDAAQMWALPDDQVVDHVRKMEAPVEIVLDDAEDVFKVE